MLLKILLLCQVEPPHCTRQSAPPRLVTNLTRAELLTIAFSCELLACAMPRMLVVCITSTEKLGSQLAIRDPKTNKNPAQIRSLSPCRLLQRQPLRDTSWFR